MMIVKQEYKVYVYSRQKQGYAVAGLGIRDAAGVKTVLDRCEKNNATSGMDWDTSTYRVLARNVTYSDWEVVEEKA